MVTATAKPTPGTIDPADAIALLTAVHLRDGLLEAAESRRYGAVADLLKSIPTEVESLTTYLPCAAPDKRYGQARNAAWAQEFASVNSAFGMLARYFEDNGSRVQMEATRDADMQQYAAMESTYDAAAQDICVVLNGTHETRLKASATFIERLMADMPVGPSLARHLAAQPFATAVDDAVVQQRGAEARLCEEILKTPVDDTLVRHLALMSYAGVVTASTREPLDSTVDRTRIDTLRARIDARIARLERDNALNTLDAEVPALKMLRSRLPKTRDKLA